MALRANATMRNVVGKALSILVITRIAFLGKMMWKTAKIPCKMAKARDEAMEELAPKRVF